jgi:hypothetical protein
MAQQHIRGVCASSGVNPCRRALAPVDLRVFPCQQIQANLSKQRKEADTTPVDFSELLELLHDAALNALDKGLAVRVSVSFRIDWSCALPKVTSCALCCQ